MYTVYKMKNELGEEVELVEKKEFDKLVERSQKVHEFIVDKIEKSFNADYGIEPFNISDRLFSETIIELQLIDQMLQVREGASNCE